MLSLSLQVVINNIDMEYETPKEITQNIHLEWSKNPFYVEGFNSNDDKNPYKLDVKLNLEVIRLSQVEPFTEEDGHNLKVKKTELDESPYCAWSMGNHMKEKYPFLKH